MVRTRANPAAARKSKFYSTLSLGKCTSSYAPCFSLPTAVAAKAPRKTLAAPSPSSVSPTSNNKKKPGCSGNPLKLWPKPSWQKGLMAFIASGGGEESSGCSSSSSGDSNDCEIEKNVVSEETTQPTIDMEGVGSSSSNNMPLLGSDIAQLNSDSEED